MFEASPIVEPGSLYYLVGSPDPARHAEAITRLGTLTREALFETYKNYVRNAKRKELWYAAEEMCRRGVPPVFRPSPWANGELTVPESDLLWLDLQWLVTAYPTHQTMFERWRRLFKRGQFHRTAGWVHGAALRDPGYYVRGLGLTPDQQAELLFLQSAPAKKKRLFLWAHRKRVLDRLKTRHHTRARAVARGDPDSIIERRGAVWLCGSLANWMPQRTADLYKAMTGAEMTRQVAKKVMEDVWRDLPESKPRPPRRTRARG